jgi:hypothetical protein
MLSLVDPELEWTYSIRATRAELQVCHWRQELQVALERQAKRGPMSELEDVTSAKGIALWWPCEPQAIDAYRARQADVRNYDVLTVREGRIVASTRATTERKL